MFSLLRIPGLTVAALGMVLSMFAYAEAQAADPQYVTTEKGYKVKLIVLSKGKMTIAGEHKNEKVGEDSQGGEVFITDNLQWIIEHTNEMRFAPDNGFGFLFAVPKLEKNDKIIIQIRIDYKMKGAVDTQSLTADWVFDAGYANTNSPVRWHIRDGDSEVETVGDYVFNVLHKGRLLDSAAFKVLPAQQ